MAIIACILGAPISLLANTLITKVLAVPTSSSSTVVGNSTDENYPRDRKSSADIGEEYQRHSSLTSREKRKRSSVADSKTDLTALGPLSFMFISSDQLGTTLSEDLSAFMDKLISYRNNILSPNVPLRIEFDEIWGIDPIVGHIRSDTEELSWWDEMMGKEKDVHKLIVSDLAAVRAKTAKELHHLSHSHVTDKERGKRLLRLFQQDLLPGLSGDIIESTDQDNVHASPTAPWWGKLLAWCVLIGLNVGMIFYVYLFAMNQTKVQQDAWVKSFVLWIVMDVIIVATITVYIKNIVIPSYAMSDLRKIRSKIIEAVKDGLTNLDFKRENYVPEVQSDVKQFNSAEYFFVSTRVATQFPELRESKIILNYVTTWPKRSYQRTHVISQGYISNSTAFTKSIGMIAGFAASHFITCPNSLQNFYIQTSLTTSVGYVFVGMALLYKISILLVFAFIISVIILVHYAVKWNAGKLDTSLLIKQSNVTKVFPIPPTKSPSVDETATVDVSLEQILRQEEEELIVLEEIWETDSDEHSEFVIASSFNSSESKLREEDINVVEEDAGSFSSLSSGTLEAFLTGVSMISLKGDQNGVNANTIIISTMEPSALHQKYPSLSSSASSRTIRNTVNGVEVSPQKKYKVPSHENSSNNSSVEEEEEDAYSDASSKINVAALEYIAPEFESRKRAESYPVYQPVLPRPHVEFPIQKNSFQVTQMNHLSNSNEK